jgi:enterochelin esterase-like enzyme
VIEEKTVKSNIMNRSVNYTIYLPPDYSQSERTYPVVYLLHGYTDDAFLSNANCKQHILLTDKKVPHEFRMRDGEHNWQYWRTCITDAFQFIGKSFHQ